MGIEIGRKFLVAGEGWRPHVAGRKHLRQAYLAWQGKAAVRIRIVDNASAALTIKPHGARTSRPEYEYPSRRRTERSWHVAALREPRLTGATQALQ